MSLEEDGLVHLVLACYWRCPLYMLLVTVGTDLLQQRYSQGERVTAGYSWDPGTVGASVLHQGYSWGPGTVSASVLEQCRVGVHPLNCWGGGM